MSDDLIFDKFTPLIQFNDTSFKYSMRGQTVLKQLKCKFYAGHIYGLLGKNGVGKSTTFRLITGMNPPSTGTVETLGNPPKNRLPSMLSEVFLLPEEIEFPNINIEEYGRKYGQFYPNFSNKDLLNYMNRFFAPMGKAKENPRDYLTQPLKTMSQGQRKKACIAFALACNTKILLMDEPTNGLDIPGKTVFREVLATCQNPNRCIIISTHQVRDLESLIDAVVILSEETNSVVISATAENILKVLHFGATTPDMDIIYEQKVVGGGNTGISKRRPDMPVQDIQSMDLELLFNATMASGETVSNLLMNSEG